MEEYGKIVQLLLASLGMAVAMGFLYHYYIKPDFAGLTKDGIRAKNNDKKAIVALLITGLFAKTVVAALFRGFEADMNCFKGWGSRLLEVGFKDFYSEGFSDYPPGYIYVLGILSWFCESFKIGWNADTLSIDWTSAATDVVFKMPAILCDLAAGFYVYKMAKKKFTENTSLLLAAFYIFNPAIMINSAVWGQVDSIYVLFVLLLLDFIIQRKLPCAYVVFGIGIIVKPQMLFFGPFLLWAIIEQVILNNFSWKKFFKHLCWGIGAIVVMILFTLPFGTGKVFSQFFSTVGSYEYSSVNAYNFWTMIGRNWSDQNEVIFGLSAKQWGMIAIVLVLGTTFLLLSKNKKDKSRYFLISAFFMTGVFLFSVRMHERYMYPALVLLLLAFVTKPKKELMYAYIGFSIVQLLNVGHVLYYYPDYFSTRAMFPMLIGLATLILFVYLCYIIKRFYVNSKQSEKDMENEIKLVNEQLTNPKDDFELEDGEVVKIPKRKIFPDTVIPSGPPLKMLLIDWIIMIAIVLIYGAVALYDLGSSNTPNTEYMDDQWYATVTLDFGKEVTLSQIDYYLGVNENREIIAEVSDTGEEGSFRQLSTDNENNTSTWVSVMSWGTQDISTTTRYLKLTCNSDKLSLFELVFLDENGNIVTPVNADEYPNLFDEQDKFEDADFRNGTYFDEVYHARTAYEYIKGRYSYENTHPPLGKCFIALGMLIFGVCPFGWRIMGTLFGIAMLLVIYLFGKKMFKETWLATIVTILFAVDFMHFTQSRIATIDVFITFFVLLMYFFMYCYTKRSFYDRSFPVTMVILSLSGVAMGFGIASKWTGVYAAAGLAVIFFIDAYRRIKEYKYACKNLEGTTNGISHRLVADKFISYTIITATVCIVSFVLIPVIIYTLSYIPFVDGYDDGLINMMLRNQTSMFNYHSELNATHPYSSAWYQWPFVWKPMFYYTKQISSTVTSGISAFGNPAVWYAGIAAAFYMLYLAVTKKDRNALFLLLGYLAQYLPWMLVSRCVFIYHYFPSVPFVILMVGYSIKKLFEKNRNIRKYAYVYVGFAVLLFIMFYPVLSGQNVSYDYVNTWLKWFDKWALIM